ncbi:MAG: PAS-domain containing protein [Pseudomonadota bacterium]|nr:PAS-domain containing protein [Pseudomonadota bacterium]
MMRKKTALFNRSRTLPTEPSPLNIPFATLVLAALVIAVFLVIGFKTHMSAPTMTLVGFSALTAVLAVMTFLLERRVRRQGNDIRQLRLVAERLQAILGATPGGYCLFTPQGILRETARVPAVLGIEKVTHFEDLVGAVREATDFVAAFRKLQRSGEAFVLPIETSQDARPVYVTGKRFRIGREGPLVDALWFNIYTPVAPEGRAADEVLPARPIGLDVHAFMEALPFPVWRRRADLGLAFCNQAYASALDASVEDVVREQHELASQTAKGGSGRTLSEKAMVTGQPQTERRHVIIAGQRRLMEITEIPLLSNPKEKPTLLGFAIDVTAEEDKETELQRHLAAQHEVLEHLGSAIVIYGPDTRLEFYNRAYQRLWDSDEAFLNGKPTFGEIIEDLRTRRRAPEQADFQRYKRERTSLFTSLLEPREDLMHLPDGTTLRILAVPHPFGGIMFVHEDVTDKLALESSYNTLIAVQRETLDNLAEGIAVFGPDGKLRLFNPAFASIWKLEPDFLGTGPHIADLLEHMKPLFDFGENWTAFKNETVEYTLDRSARRGRSSRADHSVIEFITVPLPDGAVLNSYLDVTDSVRVEQALRASNAALATADRLKSEFVANVSYQLRTPLNTIMGFAEILTNQYFGTLNDKQVEYTRTIMDASRKLLLLINDVLDLATIEAGRMALNRHLINVADLMNAAKQMTVEWAKQQSLDIAVDCPSGIGTFDADEHRMKQVLFNLISNAIKYTPAGGHITLEARREEPWIVLTVADTGIGIPESDRERVFGKFERGNNPARHGGAGLGLSLVKSFVELHGGTIEITGAPGKGTRISCRLPVVAPGTAESIEASN